MAPKVVETTEVCLFATQSGAGHGKGEQLVEQLHWLRHSGTDYWNVFVEQLFLMKLKVVRSAGRWNNRGAVPSVSSAEKWYRLPEGVA